MAINDEIWTKGPSFPNGRPLPKVHVKPITWTNANNKEQHIHSDQCVIIWTDEGLPLQQVYEMLNTLWEQHLEEWSSFREYPNLEMELNNYFNNQCRQCSICDNCINNHLI